MKKLAAVFTLALVGCAPQSPEAPTASSEAVGVAFQNWINGWTGRELEVVVAPFTENSVIYDPYGDFVGSAGARDWAEGTFAAMNDITIAIRDASVNVVGPAAWVTGSYDWTATLEGETESFTDTGKLSMLWVLQEDGSYASPVFHASAREDRAAGSEGGG